MPGRLQAAPPLLVAIGLLHATACSREAAKGGADAGTDTTSSPDVSTRPPSDAAVDALTDADVDATPPYGDRNLGLVQPYPDNLLIQNGGRFYNVKNPPSASEHAAAGDGQVDDTAAFQDAYDFLKAQLLAATGVGSSPTPMVPNANDVEGVDSYWIYVPDGTYLVSDTLIYRGESLQAYYTAAYDGGDPFGSPWFDITRVRVVGQSREGTILKLANQASGFGEATQPKPVLALQHPDTTFNDWNGDNLIQNLTVSTGTGNPGAIGILVQGANVSGMRNVLVQSGDGAGVYGIWMPIAPVQGCYDDLTVVGFDYGIAQTNAHGIGGINGCFENVTLKEQNKAGVLVALGGLVARNLWTQEAAANVPAALMNNDGAQLLVIDSLLSGSGGPAIVATSGMDDSLFARNVTTEGYASAISYGGQTVVPGPSVTEYSSGVLTLFDGGMTSLALAAPQVPTGTWYDPTTQWANVESYRTDANPSDTEAAQAALDSGLPVVTFPRGSYTMQPLSIPAFIARIDLLFTNLPAGGEFDITEPSGNPIFIENGSTNGFTVVSKAQRDVVLRMKSNNYENPDNLPVTAFIVNGGGGADVNFVPAKGMVWARGLDIEYRPTNFVASGGTLWIMGYKTEGPGSVLSLSAGSTVEVLGGYAFLDGTSPGAMITNDSATISFIGSKTTNPPGANFTPVVSEIQAGVTRTADAGSFPPYVGRDGTDFIVPLYVSHAM